jgi:hypothetical protein
VTVSSYRMPPAARQKGGGPPINTGDAGVLNGVYRNGLITTAHAVAWDWGSGHVVSAIRLYQFHPNGPLEQEITYGKDMLFYSYPSVMIDSRGNLGMVFSRSGGSRYAGFYYTGRHADDPPGKLLPAIPLKDGSAHYVPSPGTERSLWGDYNGICLDPDDSMWIFGEFAKTPTEWGTYAARIVF